MKISKKQSMIQQSIIASFVVALIIISIVAILRPLLVDAAKPRYTQTYSIPKSNVSSSFTTGLGPDGSLLVASSKPSINGSKIERYDTAGTLVDSFDTTLRVSNIKIGADNSIYAVGIGGAQQSEVAVQFDQGGEVITQFMTPNTNFASDIGIGLDGTVYVLNNRATEIYSPEGIYVGRWTHSFNSGSSSMVVKDGFVYISENSVVAKFLLDGQFVDSISFDADTTNLDGMTTNTQGNLILSNVKSNEIIEISTNLVVVNRTNVASWPDSALVYLWKAHVDNLGNIYIADYGMNVITKFLSNGTKTYDINRNVDGQLNNPGGSIGTDADGNVYVTDGNFIQKFDENGVFVKRFGGTGGSYLQLINGKFVSLQAIAVSRSGDIYVYDSGTRQFQKFDSEGNFVTRWGGPGSGDGEMSGDVGGMTVGVNGNLYVIDIPGKQVQAFSSSGQHLSQWSGSTDTDGIYSDLSAIASDLEGNIYTSETSPQGLYPHYFRKYSSTGVLLREWVKSGFSQNNNIGERAFSIAVDSAGKIYAHTNSTPGAINVFDDQGVYESQFKAGEINFSYQFILGVDNVIIDSGENGVRQFDYQGMTQAPSAIRNQTFDSITPGSVSVAWDAPLNDGGESIASYDVEIKKSSVASWSELEYAAATSSLQIDMYSLEPNTKYDVRVRAVSEAGAGPYLSGTFMTAAIPAKNVTSVNFATDQGQKSMTVSGAGLVGSVDAFEYTEALTRSLVTLNGVELPFCSQGIGASAAEIVDGYGVPANLVSDDPTCYMLVDLGAPAITAERAIVLLADDFDITAQGTVSVNGSNTFTFNQQTTPGNEIADPTVIVGNKSLEVKPTINKRPTFSGTAEPGATVTVTVRSDPITCTTTADSNGNWSCTLPSDLPPGDHTVTVRVVNPDNSIVELGPYAVVVTGSGAGVVTPATPLAPNTGEGRMLGLQNNHISYGVVGLSIVFALIALVTHIKQSQSAKRLRRTSLRL